MCRASEDNSNISISNHDRHLHVNIITQPTAAKGQAAPQPRLERVVFRLETRSSPSLRCTGYGDAGRISGATFSRHRWLQFTAASLWSFGGINLRLEMEGKSQSPTHLCRFPVKENYSSVPPGLITANGTWSIKEEQQSFIKITHFDCSWGKICHFQFLSTCFWPTVVHLYKPVKIKTLKWQRRVNVDG